MIWYDINVTMSQLRQSEKPSNVIRMLLYILLCITYYYLLCAVWQAQQRQELRPVSVAFIYVYICFAFMFIISCNMFTGHKAYQMSYGAASELRPRGPTGRAGTWATVCHPRVRDTTNQHCASWVPAPEGRERVSSQSFLCKVSPAMWCKPGRLLALTCLAHAMPEHMLDPWWVTWESPHVNTPDGLHGKTGTPCSGCPAGCLCAATGDRVGDGDYRVCIYASAWFLLQQCASAASHG